MMGIQIGDVFTHKKSIYNFIFKVSQINANGSIYCYVYNEKNRLIGKIYEHRNTLLKMQKLSSLEKELM